MFNEVILNLKPVLPIFLFVLGALLGSFANVVIYRWPQSLSVAWPNSFCYSCKKPIRFYDNIPIFSWLILRGKCRQCGAGFSFRYFIVEVLMASLFVIIYQFNGYSWTTLEYLIMTFGLVAASFIDLDHFLLPDVLTLSGIVIGFTGAVLNPERGVLDSLFGVLVGGGFLWAIATVYQMIRKEEGLGGGDVKLLAWIGAVLGWKSIPFVILTSCVFGTILGLIFAGKSRNGMKTMIPFGPYLSIAAILYVCGGDRIGNWYFNIFIPGLN